MKRDLHIVKNRWITFILHLTSLIQTEKDKLFVTSSYKSVIILLELILLESLLFLISIPLYFVQNTASSASGTKQYRTKRIITFSVLLSIGSIWLIKLLLGLIGFLLFANLPSFQVNEIARTAPTTAEEQQILETEEADASTALQPVKITAAKRLSSGSVELTGTASPRTHVLVYINRENTSSNIIGMTLLRTQADSKGNWSATPKEQQFVFTPGTYTSQGVSFDPVNHIKSPAGGAVSFAIKSYSTVVIKDIDIVLNWLGLFFIGLGLASTILLT